jgi:serine/threonine protein kinase/tetratricopeptide (TPR) repeat protein
VSDGRALDLLDRLLGEEPRVRESSLRGLRDTDPELHERLRRLLESALSPEHSRLLAQPVVDGMSRLQGEASHRLAAGQVLAGYRLIRELGRGGMSVVWLAERADGVVKRQVAIKMPMFLLHSAEDAARFARERDALASLSHPNVARLYDAGVMPSGQPFIVLEHVDGAPLVAYCEDGKLDRAARLRLFFQVLAAVDHAHKHLVVHRDLKPSNILVDRDGQVKLLDFGIAKLLREGEDTAPLTEQVGGAMTPMYAAPEQLRGGTISTLTDVFSLGLILHELLTASLPYAGAAARPTLSEILEALGRGELATRGIEGDLDTIVGKALRITPGDRYGSAAHFAEDLRRFLGHKPIAARGPSVWYVARLALRRHRLAAFVAGVGLVLVSIASSIAWQQNRESRAHAARTVAMRDFMFELVNDAEAGEGHEGEVTGRQMVDGAVRRAKRDFEAQPRLQGELLGELGRMYTRLGAAGTAVPVLEEGVGLLEKHAPADDPALNKSRVNLADAILQDGDDIDRVRALAQSARDSCRGADVECAKARAYAGNLLSQVASYQGDTAAARAAMRRSVADTEIGFGAAHAETAMALMSLAIIARNSGQLVEAGAAMERAVSIARGSHMRAADRTSLERTMAVLELDLGHYEAARTRLEALVAQTADPVERALQSRVLANVLVELGDGARALEAGDRAVSLARDHRATDQLPFALQARARALGLLTRYEQAMMEIEAARAALLAAGRTAESPEGQRMNRISGELLLGAGQFEAAFEIVSKLRALQARVGASPADTGRSLDLLGRVQAARGDWSAAASSHESARRELVKQLPPDHPDLIRNAALREAAARLAPINKKHRE